MIIKCKNRKDRRKIAMKICIRYLCPASKVAINRLWSDAADAIVIHPNPFNSSNFFGTFEKWIHKNVIAICKETKKTFKAFFLQVLRRNWNCRIYPRTEISVAIKSSNVIFRIEEIFSHSKDNLVLIMS